ncbi:uracil-DNA glycosylase [Candidatus Woesearchaeota archaeon]|nr:uracil-DNA glycosylase [Candidatus Woesearchaeota archaeon]
MTCRWIDICPLRKLEQEGQISQRWKKEYCESKNSWRNCKRFRLEGKNIPHPDNMLPDGTIKEKE